MSPRAFAALLACIVLACSGVGGGLWYYHAQKHRPPEIAKEPPPPVREVPARIFQNSFDLHAEYAANEARADAAYLGKLVDVGFSSFTVDKLRDGTYCLCFSKFYGHTDAAVVCTFSPGHEADLAALKPGTLRVVRGRVAGKKRETSAPDGYYVLLERCELVDVPGKP